MMLRRMQRKLYQSPAGGKHSDDSIVLSSQGEFPCNVRQFAANMQPMPEPVILGKHVRLGSFYNRRKDSASKYQMHFQGVKQVPWVAVEYFQGLLP